MVNYLVFFSPIFNLKIWNVAEMLYVRGNNDTIIEKSARPNQQIKFINSFPLFSSSALFVP